jgi:hypothetical protein
VVETELDGPPGPPWEEPCWLCGKPVKMHYFWWGLGDRWLRNPPVPVHVACTERYHKNVSRPPDERFEVPPKYAEQFEPTHFKNDPALRRAMEFGPESKQHFFAIIGLPRRGKSRLSWVVMQSFFVELRKTTGAILAPETFSWADLVGDVDPFKAARLKVAPYVYLGDAGSTDIYGRSRAVVQAALRHRLERNLWTFTDIDDVRFDEDFAARLRNEAFCIWLE